MKNRVLEETNKKRIGGFIEEIRKLASEYKLQMDFVFGEESWESGYEVMDLGYEIAADDIRMKKLLKEIDTVSAKHEIETIEMLKRMYKGTLLGFRIKN